MLLVGVHSPETEGEKKEENVARKLKEHKINHPVVLDPNLDNWKRWKQQWWPTVYVVDKQGRVRYQWAGELEFQNAGGEKKVEEVVETLLRER